jgi:hypothetical protein
MRDSGGSCVGDNKLQEDRIDALALVPVGDRDGDLGVGRLVGIASELCDCGGVRIAVDGGNERVPPAVDPRQPSEFGDETPSNNAATVSMSPSLSGRIVTPPSFST